MKTPARIATATFVGLIVGAVFSPWRGDSNPGHADSTLYFAVADAQKGDADRLPERLLAIDVRYVPLRIKDAYYRYVSAVSEEAEAKRAGRDISELHVRTEAALKRFHAVAPE